MRYQLEKAVATDGIQMLEILESTPAKSNFEIICTRRPNAYHSFIKEGKESMVAVIKDESKTILFLGACIIKKLYVDSQIKKVGYIGGVRKKIGFAERMNWIDLFLEAYQETQCDVYYCSILRSNKRALKAFTQNAETAPQLVSLCSYTTFIINPKQFKKIRIASQTKFRQITRKDLARVYAFLKKEGAKYHFFPVTDDLERDFENLSIEDGYILEDNNEIVSFGCLWDQTAYKQYVITKYRGITKVISKLSTLNELCGYIPSPKEDEIIRFPMLSLFIVKDNKEEYYKCFLKCIMQAAGQTYKGIVIGANNSNINIAVLKGLKSISFESVLYSIGFKHKQSAVCGFDANKIHIENGLL